MTDQAAGGTEAAVQGPKFEIVHQYIKDLSLEVPGAPQVFQTPTLTATSGAVGV